MATIIDVLQRHGSVCAIDMRGHGTSTGETTLGMDEVLDVDAAVMYVRNQGVDRVVTLGFSVGGAAVVRHAAGAAAERGVPHQGVDAVASVSAPAFWFYRGTRIMRVVHSIVERPVGRLAMRARGTAITHRPWPTPPPMSPEEAARLIAIPFLIVHGDADHYFPTEHPHALERASEANPQRSVVIVPGLRHAESGISPETVDLIARWGCAPVRL
jgi:pimeloyl-ACP methyl ester carboxylesterase